MLAERTVPRLGDRDVVDSIRNPFEVEVLRRVPGFVLLGITAAEEARFGRSLQRARPGDPQTLDQFRRRERQENTDAPGAQRLDATFELADRVIRNDGDLPLLHRELEQLLSAY